MPKYDFRCDEGHTVEAVQGYHVASLPCTACGRPAQRVAVYAEQTIIGDTVPRFHGRSSAITKHGYIDVDQGFTAIDDVQRTARKQGVEPPDLFREAQRRVATGEATERRIAQ